MKRNCPAEGYTETCEGPIPHYPHPDLGICLPVKLMTRPKDKGSVIVVTEDGPIPQRTSDGRLIFVLPGGGEYVGPQTEPRGFA